MLPPEPAEHLHGEAPPRHARRGDGQSQGTGRADPARITHGSAGYLRDGRPLRRNDMSILGVLLIGLIAGALARLLTPGRDPIGFLGTIAVGVGGAFLGWWIGRSIVGRGGVVDHPIIWGIIGAELLLLLFRAIAGRGRLRRRYAGR